MMRMSAYDPYIAGEKANKEVDAIKYQNASN
jgi:hypothetical protein